jgi:hypothetical protein
MYLHSSQPLLFLPELILRPLEDARELLLRCSTHDDWPPWKPILVEELTDKTEARNEKMGFL